MICSSVPCEMERTKTASGSWPSKPGMSMPLGELRIERAARQRAYDDIGAVRLQRLGETTHMPIAAFLLEEERNPQPARGKLS